MNSNLTTLFLAPALLSVASLASVAEAADDRVLKLVEDGKPACALLVVGDAESQPLMRRGADAVGETVRQWTGVALDSQVLSETEADLDAGPSIVFTTLKSLNKVAPSEVRFHEELARLTTLDEQGFVCVPSHNGKQLLVVSQTPRGVYNGAIYLRDFGIDGTRENLVADFQPVVRSPQMSGRPVYTLTIWGTEQLYTAQDWETVFKSFSRDGIDRVYFWVSGHFPSKKFPQTYKCNDIFNGKLYDTTADTRIGTVADHKAIVASAHAHGLKIYLGGGLGAWCGTQFLTNLEPDTLKIGPKEPSLCPSNQKSRQALVDYYQEVFAAVPEADGLFLESADEIGECTCPLCSPAIDEFGSRQFGQSQLSLCQEIMDTVWRDHPHARIAYTIGYQEHAKDPAYYDLIKRMSADPRFEWMESRNSWSFPGPSGEARPASFFSKKFMHWNQDANTPLETLIENANRAHAEGMCGLVTCFSPGFDKGVFYKEVPIPTDALPHVLTGFVYREATWNPTLKVAEMHERVQKGFFGKEAPMVLSDDLWTLREIMRTKKNSKQLAAIQRNIEQARPQASPKTSQSLDIMQRAIDDIQK